MQPTKIRLKIIGIFLPFLLFTQTERWVCQYNGSADGRDVDHSLVYGSDGNIYVAGYSTGDRTDYDFTVINLASNTEIEDNAFPSFNKSFSVSSLFKDEFILKFSKPSPAPLRIILYDILGNSVFEKIYPCMSSSLILSDKAIKSLSPGVYFLSVSSRKNKWEKVKLIKL